MVLGWRKAFCTSISKSQDPDSPIIKDKPDPRLSRFFSNPSTPRPSLHCRTATPKDVIGRSKSAPQSPKLHCKIKNSTKFFNRSTPSSPRSPSAFSLIKSSIGLSKQSRCGICLQKAKTGEGTAIFTAECGHSFHSSCIGKHVSLTCPTCSCTWKEKDIFQDDHHQQTQQRKIRCEFNAGDLNSRSKNDRRSVLKVYNDDEPLSSPTCGARFNPIPESDETEEENEEFPGFFAAKRVVLSEMRTRNVEVSLSPETAVVSVGKNSETYAVVLKIKAPAASSHRAPIDLVTVIDVSRSVTADKLLIMKRAMRLVVSSLSAADRLSIVAFSTTSKRLLPLRRMNTAGKRSARRIIDAIVSLDSAATSAADSIKKAAKVISDRREKNPAASILLFSDGHRNSPIISSTNFSDSDTPVHSINLSACINAPPDDTIGKCISGLLRVVVIQDLKIQLGMKSGSSPAEVSAVYSYNRGKPDFLGSGSSWCTVGCLHSEEERELLIELKIPSAISGAQRTLSVTCSNKVPSTQQFISNQRSFTIPRPGAVGSSSCDIRRFKCFFVTTRGIAESRRLVVRDDVVGAHHMLASAQLLVLQSGSSSAEEFVHRLEAELAELKLKRRNNNEREAESNTPTSAWRAAERLAKLAVVRKSLNRVSDLHGFEDARF